MAWLPLNQPLQSSQQVRGKPRAVEQQQTREAKLKLQRYHRRLLGGESPIHQPNTKPQLKSKPKYHCLSSQSRDKVWARPGLTRKVGPGPPWGLFLHTSLYLP